MLLGSSSAKDSPAVIAVHSANENGLLSKLPYERANAPAKQLSLRLLLTSVIGYDRLAGDKDHQNEQKVPAHVEGRWAGGGRRVQLLQAFLVGLAVESFRQVF